MNAVTFLSADRNVINNIRVEHLQGLHKQGCGSLSVYIKVAPDADEFIAADSFANAFNSRFDIREWCRWKLIGVQKGAGGVGSQNPASDESLRDEGMQAQG